MAETQLKVDKKNAFYSTGRRKTAVARVWMMPGSGRILINRRELDNYFGRATSKMVVRQPLELTETVGRYDIAMWDVARILSRQVSLSVSASRSSSSPVPRIVIRRASTSASIFRAALDISSTGRSDLRAMM